MKSIIILAISLILSDKMAFSQNLQLQGIINVWNNSSSIITLTDDFYYALAPGDELSVTISGTANIAPYDEERKGGGFLGLFKKSYKVRIDNWLTADQVNLKVKIAQYADITLTANAADKTQSGIFTIPFDPDPTHLKEELLKQFKVNAWINQYMSPLRAGKYDIKILVNSSNRLVQLKNYFISPEVGTIPILNFENNIKKYVENGKLIYKHPDETVTIIEDALSTRPNIDGIKKDLYKYLLQFAPDNTSVRAGLAEVYLKELNFSDAQIEAQKTIVLLSAKPANTLTNKEQNDFGRAYEVIAGVNELKELGLQENAYSMGAVFYGEAAEWYRKASSAEEYTKAIMKQVRCLQKVGDLIALKQAASILQGFETEITR